MIHVALDDIRCLSGHTKLLVPGRIELHDLVRMRSLGALREQHQTASHFKVVSLQDS